jgi:anaphase-promoting complex subunit 4
MILHRRRLLIGCRHGEAELAVNGRKQRRIACVLDSQGSRLETFDLGEENEEMEEEGEEEEE